VSRIVLCDEETAARLFVQTVNNAGSFLSANAGQRRAMMKQCIDQGVFAMAGTWMNDEPGRFIDDDEIFVLKQNVEWNRLRLSLDFFGRRLDKLDFVPVANNLPRSRGYSVEPDESRSNQLLKARPRMVRKMVCKKTIEAKLCIVL
jgi:hypothetical protein